MAGQKPAEKPSEEALSAMEVTLKAMGVDLTDENFADTPMRWLKALAHFQRPYNPADDLKTGFEDPGSRDHSVPPEFAHGMLVQSGIPFRAMCAHHLLPFMGIANVAYIPNKRVVGLSKLSRVVYGISHETPSLQEHIGQKIADALYRELDAHGSACTIHATHGCMECRGIEESGVITHTSHMRGVFIHNASARMEFLELIKTKARGNS